MKSSCGSVWLTSVRSCTSVDSRFFRVVAMSVRFSSAIWTAASRSTACGAAVGRSVGTIVARHSSSSVPLTMRRLSASSSLRSVACALTSVCRRVASSACACTTSIGAMVPISTRERLSATSFDARSSDACAASSACRA